MSSLDNIRGVRKLPRSRQVKVKEVPKEGAAEKTEETKVKMPKVPSILDIMSPDIVSDDDGDAEVVAAAATESTMKYLMRKEKEKAKMTQELLRILPELGKSDNPLVAIMVDKLISSGPASNDDISELKELAKAMSYTVILPELMKDVAKSIRGGDEEKMMAMLIQILDERDRRLQELIAELKENKDQEMVDSLREELYQSLNAIVETFSKSLEEIKAQITMSQTAQPNDPFASLDQLDQWIERSQALLEKLGYVVAKPDELNPAVAANLDAEKEIKLKELELKSKEIEAKNQLYSKIGEAVTKLVENPDNIAKLIQVAIGLFRRGVPSPQASSVNIGESVAMSLNSKPSKIPSLSEFVTGGVRNGEDKRST